MRVDYLAPGRGKYFIARAETLRLGRKGCTMRMTMVNDEDQIDCNCYCFLCLLVLN